MAGRTEDNPLCILVIDDHRDALEVFGLLLRKLGHSVHTSPSGESGLKLIESLHPDLVFLDLSMPGLDGYEVARRLRRHEKLKETRIIAVTGYGDRPRRDLAFEAGFDDYLVKPATLADVQAVIERTRELLEQAGEAAHPSC